MNRQLNLPQLQKIMMEFERESEIMDLKEETISDTIDDAIGEDDEDEVRREREIQIPLVAISRNMHIILLSPTHSPPKHTHTHTCLSFLTLGE